jgi:hypothetical protein
MRTLALLLAGVTGLAFTALAEQPRGQFLEVHSCELFAGGCTVSSEATLDGRYMLRAWNFTGGSFAGTDLAGLKLAVLQSASENLAAPNAEAGSAVVYLPKDASAAQRQALLKWLKTSQSDFKPAKLKTRVVPLQFSQDSKGESFSAGSGISIKTVSIESCEAGACGEALWYQPRAIASLFTVAVDRSLQVTEPYLKLTWTDSGKRSVFLGKFGEGPSHKNVFVSTTDLCGPDGKLF